MFCCSFEMVPFQIRSAYAKSLLLNQNLLCICIWSFLNRMASHTTLDSMRAKAPPGLSHHLGRPGWPPWAYNYDVIDRPSTCTAHFRHSMIGDQWRIYTGLHRFAENSQIICCCSPLSVHQCCERLYLQQARPYL